MVSHVVQPPMPLAIFLHYHASKFMSSCRVCCQALSRRASSVGCSSLEDDLLNSLEGVSSLGLGWCHFRWVDFFLIGLCISLLVHPKDVAYTREGVSDWRVVLTLVAIGGHRAIAQDLSFSLTGLRILIFAGGILLHVGGFIFAAGLLAVVSGLRLGGA